MKRKSFTKVTLLLSSLMTMMAGAVVAPSLPQISQHFNEIPNYEVLTRLIITLPALFIAIFSPINGWLIDKFGRKKILLGAYALYAIAGTTGFYLTDLYLILVGRAFLGIAVAGVMTCTVALIGDYYQGAERNSFMGYQGAFMSLGGVTFISVAGFLADVQWQAPFLLYLFSILIFILASIFLYEPEREKIETKNEFGQKIKMEYSRGLIFFIGFLAFFGITFFYMIPVQIPYILKGIGVKNSLTGIAISSSTLASSIVSINFRKIRKLIPFQLIYATAFTFMGTGYFIISQSHEYYQFIMGLVVSGLGTGLLMPSGNLWAMEVTPPQIRGRIVGRISSAAFIGMFFSPIILQPVIKGFELSGAFMFASSVLIFMAILLVSFRKNKLFKMQ